MWPHSLIRLIVRRNPGYFIRAIYRGVLQRDADPEGLAAYSLELSKSGDLIAVAGGIARSGEAWNKNLYANPAGLIDAVFRGILGREPDPRALQAYTEYLSKDKNLVTLMSIVCQSQEHWEKLIAEHAEDVVRATFLGILKREPDAEALSVYSTQLRQQRDLSALLSIVASSGEHWDLLLQEKRHSGHVLQSDNLPSLLAAVVASQKVWNDLSALKFPSGGAASAAFENDAWVFVHAQKTAGTSLQNMLIDTFGDQNVYREHADTLYMRSPAELSQYGVFAGHFNFDSLSYIPRRRLQLITLLREPKQRLISLYRFLRAHEPSAPSFNGGIEIANQLYAADFFRSVLATAASETWNHLTWCIMGQRWWSAYKRAIDGLSAEAMQVQLDVVRSEIRDRLRQFAFIGFQEDFPYSCQRLFELIGARMPSLRHDHSVELLSDNLQYFKYVESEPITPDLDAALEPLVQLDTILFREARDIYGLQNGRVGTGGEFRAV